MGKKFNFVKRSCIICNGEFNAEQKELKRGWALCCSKSCSNSHNAKKKAKKYNNYIGENNPAWKGGVSKFSKRCASAVQRALAKGKLLKGKCLICESEKVEAHHCDYNKPLDVMWLCRKHHAEWHRNNQAIYPDSFNGLV